MKKRIIFFLPTLNGGGAERVSVNIMKQLDREMYDIHLVLVKKVGEYLDLIPEDIKIHTLASSKTMYSIIKLRKLIQKLEADIVYSTLYRSHIALFFSLLGIRNRPSTILRMPNSPKLVIENREISKATIFLLNLALKKATCVIAQTPQMKEEISLYHNINLDRIDVIINPLDTKLIKTSIQNSVSPFDTQYINVVASGRLMHQKGYDILIKAFKEVYDTNLKFRLFIIGGDYSDKKKEYEALVDNLNLESVVNFLGFQKNPYVYYHYCDLFVMASRWEGLPNTILENLYLKKRIVATNCIPFMTKLIDDGVNVFLVEVEKPIGLAKAIISFKSIPERGYINSFKEENISTKFNI